MTAVEWIEETIDKKHMGAFLKSIIEQAKELEKQQIIDSFNKGFITDQWDKSKENKAEQYYNETFKSE
jgi:predicted secreted protein